MAIKISAPKHWAYRNADGKYVTDPEIRDASGHSLMPPDQESLND